MSLVTNGFYRRVIAAALAVGLVGMASMVEAAPRKAYDRDLVRRIVVDEASRSQFVPPALALALAQMESGFQADVESPVGARGVMQIMPRTARTVFGVDPDDLWDPRLNARLGIAFLDRLVKRYGRLDLALSHYNGGSAVGRPPNAKVIPATRSFVDGVLAIAARNERDRDVAHLIARAGRNPDPLLLTAIDRAERAGEGGSPWRDLADARARRIGGQQAGSKAGVAGAGWSGRRYAALRADEASGMDWRPSRKTRRWAALAPKETDRFDGVYPGQGQVDVRPPLEGGTDDWRSKKKKRPSAGSVQAAWRRHLATADQAIERAAPIDFTLPFDGGRRSARDEVSDGWTGSGGRAVRRDTSSAAMLDRLESLRGRFRQTIDGERG